MEAFSAELSLSLEISAEYAVGDNFPAGFSARESNLKFSFFYNCFSALGGRRAGVCISADSAAGEAEALLNIEIKAEHAVGRCYCILVEN